MAFKSRIQLSKDKGKVLYSLRNTHHEWGTSCCGKKVNNMYKKCHLKGRWAICPLLWADTTTNGKLCSAVALHLKEDVNALKRLWDRAVKTSGDPAKDITKQMESSVLHTMRQEITSQKKDINCKFWSTLSKETMESISSAILKSRLDKDDKIGLGTAHPSLGDKVRPGFFGSFSNLFHIAVH